MPRARISPSLARLYALWRLQRARRRREWVYKKWCMEDPSLDNTRRLLSADMEVQHWKEYLQDLAR